MDKEFVTYKQALALKELGFNNTPWFGNQASLYDVNSEHTMYTNYGVMYSGLSDGYIPAPLKQQVFRWFREKYEIQGYIYSSTVRGNTEGTKQFTGYVWNINGIDKPFISTDARDELHDTYEEAENACIDKLIEIAKQQDNG
jgi:hypothetical protein